MKKIGLKLIILLTMLVAAFEISASDLISANNHSDTRFSRYNPGDGGNLATGARKKTDASSMYTYNDRSDGPYVAMAYAARGPWDINKAKGFYKSYKVRKGQRVYVKNLVYENGYRYGGLLISPYCGHVNMLWSPDSI